MSETKQAVLTVEEQEKVYRATATAPYANFLGHRYAGFAGKRCSQMHSDDRKGTIQECAWVWDYKRNDWIKRPAIVKAEGRV